MKLGIDATSTFSGGALVHLNQLLENSSKSEFDKIFVWTNSNKLNNFLKYKNISIIKIDKKNLINRFFWQRYTLTKELKNFPNASQFDLEKYFKESFFESKKVVHIPL